MRMRQYPPALVALGWLLEPDDASKTTALFEAIETVQRACSAVGIWTSEYEDELAWLEQGGVDRARLAGQWLELRQGQPWQAPLATRRQLTTTRDATQPGGESFVLTSDKDPDVVPADAGCCHDDRDGNHRTANAVERGSAWFAGRGQQMCGLHPAHEARVYEIRTTADWQALDHVTRASSSPIGSAGTTATRRFQARSTFQRGTASPWTGTPCASRCRD
jgi:hypothetical protein